MTGSVVLAVDLGGSAMKGAVIGENGEVIASETRATPRLQLIDALVELLEALRRAAGDRGYRVVAAGVVTPGIVDEDTGVVLYASNLHWRDVPLRGLLAERMPFPVAIGHDVRAAGLAEQLLGAARGSDDFVLVTIGTGVAAALITAGHTITGAAGAAGEFGHIPVVPGGEVCACGQIGCLEVYASAAGVTRRYAALGGAARSSREIVSRLGSDPLADAVWADATRVLAQGLAIMTLLLDPAVVVLGGGFSQAGSALLTPVTAGLAAGLAWREAPEVRLSHLGGNAGRTGAAILAFRAAGRGAVVDGWPPAD
ncbi:ROK family protein [Cryobacterium tepidiphilum]|uniref:ROK family protein n=1 Tax=Cryobacterium tepidiphilum TaxID=2486026 RepID=A0A3M8LFC8_9MICO|nr:ROK family protein [Cryobacterium tepidiphilum]RNE64150.1 ROK family protein [Cryobacterium tepidiphilum]